LNCFRCHAIGGVGERVGPDLLEPRPDKTLEYLIEAVLLPNKVMRKGFETVTVLTDSGHAFSGVLLEETDTELVLRDLTRPEIRIPKDTIEDRVSGISLMPKNVVSMLTRQDVVDLVRFLTELGKPGAPNVAADPVIRRWQVLDPVPKNIAKIDPDKFIADSAMRRDLTWEPAYSRLTGELALETAIVAPQSGRRIVRCEINVVKSGNLPLELNSTDGLLMWLDGVPFEAATHNLLEVEAGTRALTFVIDLDQRNDKTLRCEIGQATDSPAEVRLAGMLPRPNAR
jgi:putative heme-binding domain-containing protein